MTADEDEVAYYRAVEDLFSGLRGCPHVLSSVDFQLLRSWWREGVPLAAVRAGLAEVIARRRDRGDDDPVVSLRYCRHAVRRHGSRLARMRVGETEPADSAVPTAQLARLADEIDEAAERLGPPFATVLTATAEAVRAAVELTPAQVEPHLYDLESTMLQGCLELAPDALRAELEAGARTAAVTSGAEGEAFERTCRAHLDRLIRDRLGLPRLELGEWS